MIVRFSLGSMVCRIQLCTSSLLMIMVLVGDAKEFPEASYLYCLYSSLQIHIRVHDLQAGDRETETERHKDRGRQTNKLEHDSILRQAKLG